MRVLWLVCLTGALTCALSAGTIVFGNTGESGIGVDGVDASFVGPLYDSFTSLDAAGQITDLQIVLSLCTEENCPSSGTVDVGLYADSSTTPGTGSPLGSISDTLLSDTPATYDIPLTAFPVLTADTRYWIGLSGDTMAQWSYESDDSGIGVSGEFFDNQTGVSSDSIGPYQMQVTVTETTPEPASIFLFLTGAAILALFRRARHHSTAY